MINKKIPIYGNGMQIRDWIYVVDHVKALEKVFMRGSIGQTYNISTNNTKTNIDIIKNIIKIFDRIYLKKIKVILI